MEKTQGNELNATKFGLKTNLMVFVLIIFLMINFLLFKSKF